VKKRIIRKHPHKRLRAKLDSNNLIIDRQGSLVDALTIPADPSIETMPEKALCIGVIMMAIADATFNDKTIKRSDKRDAREWLLSPDKGPQSFLWWFSWLSLPDSYANKIRKIVTDNIDTGVEPNREAVRRLFF
jgi:hypothetical protein